LQACELLHQFTSGRSFDDYGKDALLRLAVERQFEIIGEALSRALRVDPTLASAVTDSGRIIAFRNRLMQGYASVTRGSNGARDSALSKAATPVSFHPTSFSLPTTLRPLSRPMAQLSLLAGPSTWMTPPWMRRK
jgi:hypothetical protein